MKNLFSIVAVLVLVSGCVAKKTTADNAPATAPKSDLQAQATNNDASKAGKVVDATKINDGAKSDKPAAASDCKDLDLSGVWDSKDSKGQNLGQLKIRKGEPEYQAIAISADASQAKVKIRFQLNQDTCVLTSARLGADLKPEESKYNKLSPKKDDASKLVSIGITPCSDATCGQLLFDQAQVLSPGVAPKVADESQASQSDAVLDCSKLNLSGTWKENIDNTGMIEGGSTNEMVLSLKNASDLSQYDEVQNATSSGFALNVIKATYNVNIDLKSCVVTEVMLTKKSTMGSMDMKAKVDPAPSYSKILAYAEKDGAKSIRLVPCADAACASPDLSKAFEFNFSK